MIGALRGPDIFLTIIVSFITSPGIPTDTERSSISNDLENLDNHLFLVVPHRIDKKHGNGND